MEVKMDVFLIKVVFAVIGIGIAYGFGKWLKRYMDSDSAMLWAIVAGRIVLIVTDAIDEVITK